jgi:glyoxylate utilization-related uncharacterized protein
MPYSMDYGGYEEYHLLRYNAIFNGLHGIIPQMTVVFRKIITAYTSLGKHNNKINYRTDS